MRRTIACKWNAEMTNILTLAVGENALAEIGRYTFVAKTKLQRVKRSRIVIGCHPVAHRAAAGHFVTGKIDNIAFNASVAVTPASRSIRSAQASAGKFASAIINSSPCPMALR